MNEKTKQDLAAAKKKYEEALYAYDNCPRDSAYIDMALTNDLRAAAFAYKNLLEATNGEVDEALRNICG